MNKTEYNKYSKQATNALKEGKRKYDEIVNFITDDLLKPFGYNHKSRIVYKNKNYKIHKATLNEDGEIENLNADDPEGIGATGFTMRTTRPANNKNFITRGSGGWNTCIKGNPRYQYADALANCVGYASGRFNEIINIARETTGCTYTTLNCNAVGFKERAEAAEVARN